MGFLQDITKLLDAARPAPQGLDLAIDAIDGVIRAIDLQMVEFKPKEFATQGEIQRASFGGADAAPNLATHYSRAHEVTWKTLDGLKTDLEAFQQACRAAKDQIVRADEDVTQELQRTQSALEELQVGSSTGHGSQAHQNAQQNQNTNGADA